MNTRGILFWFLLSLVTLSSFGQATVQRNITSQSRVRLSLSNIGTFGDSFDGRRTAANPTPSCEFPAGSFVEHLFEAGFWVGGTVNGANLVSTAAVDAPQGYATGRAGFEFTNEEGTLTERSSLFSSQFFTVDAVSHQDFVARFTDRNVLIPNTNIPIQNHTQPLEVDVLMEAYNWNFTFSDFFVILNFKVINQSPNVINDAYFSFYANTVIRNVNRTAAGSGGAAFYNKGGNGFVDSLYMSYCFDHSGDVGFTDSYIAQKLLGSEDKFGFHHPEVDSAFNVLTGQFYKDPIEVTYNAWQFNSTADPLFFQPTSDVQRYTKQTQGLNENECWRADASSNANCGQRSIVDELKRAGNRSDLVSIGPFADFAPGDTVNVVYALVFAPKTEDGNPNSDDNLVQKEQLFSNATWAQTAFNGEDENFNGILDPGEDKDGDGEITRYILPTPPNSPIVRMEARDGAIDIYWSNNSEESIDPISLEKDFEGYSIQMAEFGFDVADTNDLAFVKIAQYDLPSNGFSFETGMDSIRLESPVTFDDDTNIYFYKYTIDKALNGWQYAIAVTAFDRGNAESNLEPLESTPFASDFRVFPGKLAVEDMDENEPFVYPNPYYAGASWEGNATTFREENKKLIFANLPERCVIRVYTVAGDLIDEINHDQNYSGSDIRWFSTYSQQSDKVFSGGEHAWDLLSSETQIIARGVYIFTVEDLDSGNLFKGKFLVIK